MNDYEAYKCLEIMLRSLRIGGEIAFVSKFVRYSLCKSSITTFCGCTSRFVSYWSETLKTGFLMMRVILYRELIKIVVSLLQKILLIRPTELYIRITSPCNEHPLTSHFYIEKVGFTLVYIFLAHLSRRLIGELIGYPWSGVRPSSVRCPSSVHNAQRSSSPKLLGQSKPNFMWSLLG